MIYGDFVQERGLSDLDYREMTQGPDLEELSQLPCARCEHTLGEHGEYGCDRCGCDAFLPPDAPDRGYEREPEERSHGFKPLPGDRREWDADGGDIAF
jgi:hypothetical protein